MRSSKLTRRDLVKMLGLGAAGVMVASCGSAPAPTAAPAAPAATTAPGAATKPAATAVAPAAPGAGAPVTVKFVTSGEKEEFVAYDATFDAFEAKNKNIKVDRNYDASLSWEKIIAMIRTGVYGDIGRCDDDSMFMMMASGTITPLDNYIAKDIKKEDYLDYVWQVRDGPGHEVASIPCGSGNVVAYYNKAIFDKKGIKIPTGWTTDNWSMEDFEKAMAEVTEKKGDRVDVYGIGIGLWHTPAGAFGWGNEPYFKESTGGKIVADIATPGRIEWYTKFVRDWTQKGYMTAVGENQKQLFDNNKLAVLYEYPQYGKVINKAVNWDFGPTWRGKEPKMTARVDPGRNYVIPEVSKVKDAAWEVGKFMVSEEGETIMAKAGFLVPPANKKVASSDAFLKAYPQPGWAKVAQTMPDALPGPWPRNPAGEVFMFHVRRLDTLRQGKVDVKEFLQKEGDDACNRVLDQAQWSKDKDVKGWRFKGLLDDFVKDAEATWTAGTATAAATKK